MDNIDYVNVYVVYIIHGWTYRHATNLHAVSVDDYWLNNFIIGDSLCKMRAEEVPTEHTLPISAHIPIPYTRLLVTAVIVTLAGDTN